MTSELSDTRLLLAARRSYERGRLQGAVLRGCCAGILVLPAFLICSATPLAAACIFGFAAVVAAGRMRGGSFEDGTRAGALAGILPCLLPPAVRAFDVDLCAFLYTNGPWLCAAGGLAAGVILGLRGRSERGLPFWSSALAAFGFAASLGCIPAGAMGFAGLASGLLVGGAPVLVARRASI